MSWKEWPYWIKGGIVLTIFEIVLCLLIYLFFQFDFLNDASFSKPIIFILGMPIVLSIFLGAYAYNFMGCKWCFTKTLVEVEGATCSNPTYCDIIPMIIIILGVPIFSFLIGALIGWIIGKIKSRQEIN